MNLLNQGILRRVRLPIVVSQNIAVGIDRRIAVIVNEVASRQVIIRRNGMIDPDHLFLKVLRRERLNEMYKTGRVCSSGQQSYGINCCLVEEVGGDLVVLEWLLGRRINKLLHRVKRIIRAGCIEK